MYDFRDIALEGLSFSAAYCLRGMKNIVRANTQGLIDAPPGAQSCSNIQKSPMSIAKSLFFAGLALQIVIVLILHIRARV